LASRCTREGDVEHKNGYPLIARDSLVSWDIEHQARRAVSEEEGEIARMQAEAASPDVQHQIAEVTSEHEHERQRLQRVVHESMTNVEFLAHDRVELLGRVAQQAEQLGQARAELEALRRSSAIARGVMVDLLGSRGYCLMRLLGRWRALERGMQRALRESGS
jgi:hypothetical protein